MTLKSLPGSELTRGDHRNWVVKESAGDGANAHIINPAADQAYDQLDMIVSVPWCGLADNGVLIAVEVSMHVEEFIQIDTREIETGAVFNAFGQEVWYNTVTKEYTDTEDDGLFLVGYVILPTDATGNFRFEKVRYVTEGEGT